MRPITSRTFLFRFMPSAILLVALVSISGAAFTAEKEEPVEKQDEERVDFAKQILPLLQARCVKCHGAEKQEAGLRLDHRDSAMRGGDSGPAIVAGKVDEGELLVRIATDDEFTRMPPLGEGEPLTKAQVALVRRWIEEGASWPDAVAGSLHVNSDHWAYQPLSPGKLPAVKNSAWPRNEIDRYVLARLESEGIAPSPEANRYTLIRRLHADLIGLPPSPAEVDAFVKDESPDAYEKLVDRLLASKHFGERWGRHWLDMARYADSDGYEKDNPRPTAWRYRDWVIEAINDDMPYDRFTVAQLAGDLLPEAGPEELIATAFHRQTLTNSEGGVDREEFRYEALFDRVATTGTVWLGLTVGCAQCHSHKFDQITQVEYYRFLAFFNNGDETTTNIPKSDAALARYEKEKAAWDARLAELEHDREVVEERLSKKLPAWEDRIRAELAAAADSEPSYEAFRVVSAIAESGAMLEARPDGSFLVTGPADGTDVYTLVLETNSPAFDGVRLEALTDDSLGGKGPGRTAHGNFVLSRIRAARIASKSDDMKSDDVKSDDVKSEDANEQVANKADVEAEDVEEAEVAAREESLEFVAATADFSQEGYPVADALRDGKKSGWAINPQVGVEHAANFSWKSPLRMEKGTRLKIELEQSYGSRHTLGCFRLTARIGRIPAEIAPAEIAAILETDPASRTDAQRRTLLEDFANDDTSYKQAVAAIAEQKKNPPESPYLKVAILKQRTSSPRTSHVLRRGDFQQPGEKVQPGTLHVMHEFDARHPDDAADRLDLARWIVDPENPLTPRVTVNHIWADLFGKGIVTTLNDFGVRGDPPSHPQLLDWLATEFLRQDWSRKKLIRTIVTSATYRQSSRHRAELAERDPLNQLLYRQNRFRVDGEIVRDRYLAASGLLSRKVGGPSVFPPMPADIAALSYANNFRWNTSEGEDRYRRGMYTFFKRTAPYPNLMTFDCPNANTTSVKRDRSNTPLQALTTLNGETFVEAARAFAGRVLRKPKLESDTERLVFAFRICVARPPNDFETQSLYELLHASREYYRQHTDEAGKLVGDATIADVPLEENAAWIATGRMILNLDEFITRE